MVLYYYCIVFYESVDYGIQEIKFFLRFFLSLVSSVHGLKVCPIYNIQCFMEMHILIWYGLCDVMLTSATTLVRSCLARETITTLSCS